MRLINAEEAIKEILDVYEYEYPTASGAFDHFVTHMIPNILKNMPIVDAEPVRHAKVVTVTGRYHIMHQECSCCGGELGWKEYPVYCPNCGAKMNEVK